MLLRIELGPAIPPSVVQSGPQTSPSPSNRSRPAGVYRKTSCSFDDSRHQLISLFFRVFFPILKASLLNRLGVAQLRALSPAVISRNRFPLYLFSDSIEKYSRKFEKPPARHGILFIPHWFPCLSHFFFSSPPEKNFPSSRSPLLVIRFGGTIYYYCVLRLSRASNDPLPFSQMTYKTPWPPPISLMNAIPSERTADYGALRLLSTFF